ncbi:MAG: hypothetical protein N3D82_01645 [Ignisphaera sp.]|nr:hypothetical protein [Ignisphaera sp.]MCX8167722.1 hypothetical protein [Ignisphaera sp.]MDW8085286.1 hypothetical protein [Ignisphaera sp.]
MFKYIHLEREALKRLGGELNLYWMPCLLVKFPECRPRDVFMFDCFLRSYINNPYLGLLLLKKVPRNLKIVEEPPIEAQKIGVEKCNAINIVSELNEVSSEIYRGVYSRLYELIDKLTEYEDVEVKMRVFFRTRRYVIPAERVKDVGKKIAVESIKSVLKTLCIKRVEESYKIPIAVAEPIYTLFYIYPKYTLAGFVIGKKIIESNSHAKIINKFKESMEGIFK